MEDPGVISLVPTLVVFVMTIITHRPIESMFTIAGFLILAYF